MNTNYVIFVEVEHDGIRTWDRFKHPGPTAQHAAESVVNQSEYNWGGRVVRVEVYHNDSLNAYRVTPKVISEYDLEKIGERMLLAVPFATQGAIGMRLK